MMEPDFSKFVTREELDGRLEVLPEFRSMLREEMGRLHAGQTAISGQVAVMRDDIVGQLKIANGRTGKIEARLATAEVLLGSGKDHIVTIEKEVSVVKGDVLDVKEHGCHQYTKHAGAIKALAAVGVTAQENGALEILEDAPLTDRPTWVKRHGKKVAAGSGLVGVGVLLGHVVPWVHWLLTMVEKLVGVTK